MAARIRRRIGHGVYGEYFVGHGMARDVEPTAAAIGVAPAFVVQALGVVAEEQIFAPGLIALLQPRPRHVRGAAADEFALVAQAAVNTGNLHHQCAIPEAAASSIRRPVMKRSS